MSIKKTFAGTLAALTIFSFTGASLLSPAPVSAATEAELQAQIAALLVQIAAMSGTSSTSCFTFTTDLTLGSNSEAVRALQVYLNNKGYVVATAGAGSKGNETTYFGGLTRTALAKLQLAWGISPAVGYFGPITRAKVNADCTTGGGTTNPGTGTSSSTTSSTNNSGSLKGGEADLSNFDLRSEDSTGDEGEDEVEVFTAKFDVDDGDVRVERIEIMTSSTSSTLETDPWKYFDSVTVMDQDGNELASMDVDSRDDWDEEDDDEFRLSVSGLDYVVREGDQAELTVAFDIADTIDSDDQNQEFGFVVEEEGIRAIDAEGIDQYVGDDTDAVDFTFGPEENGDLSVQSSNADPDAAILVADEDEESDEYTVFAFDIENDEDVDSLITDVVIRATSSLGASTTDNVVRTATLSDGDDEFDCDVENAGDMITCEDIDSQIDGDDQKTFRLMVTLQRNASGTIRFGVNGDNGDVDAEGADSGDDAEIDGAATSELHTIALNGIAVVAQSTDSKTLGTNDTIGQFDITFKVTAMDDDAYIATTTDNTTSAIQYVIFAPTGVTSTDSAVITSSADLVNGFYEVNEGDTETFTVTVTIDPSATGAFSVGLDKVRFAETATTTGVTTFEVDENDEDFKAGPETIIGS